MPLSGRGYHSIARKDVDPSAVHKVSSGPHGYNEAYQALKSGKKLDHRGLNSYRIDQMRGKYLRSLRNSASEGAQISGAKGTNSFEGISQPSAILSVSSSGGKQYMSYTPKMR